MLLLIASALSAAFLVHFQPSEGPENFTAAKVLLRETVYADQHQAGHLGTLYCGCDWQWRGQSGGVIEFASCGYKIRAQAQRAKRIEWEHIVPASWLGQQRQCWQEGGRKHCNATDPVFNTMEADMHNLSPVIGEVNADRSNYRFGVVKQALRQYGRCTSKTDFKGRVFEPRDEAKGFVARVNFYIHDRYNLRMSTAQQQLFMQWHARYPVSAWELERNQRIAKHMGHGNGFVTGEQQWRLHHKNTGAGLATAAWSAPWSIPWSIPWLAPDPKPATESKAASVPTPEPKPAPKPKALPTAIKGNTNSKVYHLQGRCPSYDKVSERHTQYFPSEEEAIWAGFRKAGNCR